MFWRKTQKIESNEYKKLNERLTKAEAEINMLDVKLLNILESNKLLRTKLRKKIDDEPKDEAKDIYNGVLLPDHGNIQK